MAVHRQISPWLPVLLVAFLAGMNVTQTASPQPPEGRTAPAMVRFYGVGPAGMSAPENPLATGFALDSSASFDPGSRESGVDARPEEAEYAGRTLKENPVPLTIPHEDTSQRRRDSFGLEFDEYRCERHGFVYTTKGRCVVPVWRHTTRLPRNRPGPRIENRAQSKKFANTRMNRPGFSR